MQATLAILWHKRQTSTPPLHWRSTKEPGLYATGWRKHVWTVEPQFSVPTSTLVDLLKADSNRGRCRDRWAFFGDGYSHGRTLLAGDGTVLGRLPARAAVVAICWPLVFCVCVATVLLLKSELQDELKSAGNW